MVLSEKGEFMTHKKKHGTMVKKIGLAIVVNSRKYGKGYSIHLTMTPTLRYNRIDSVIKFINQETFSSIYIYIYI